MKTRSVINACLSKATLSNTAIVWATLIGGFSTLVLVPGPERHGLYSPQWIGVTIASQLMLVLMAIGTRTVWPSPNPRIVLGALIIGGALRGLVIALGSVWVGLQTLTVDTLVSRSLNSVVITVLGMGLIGGTIAWRNDFRLQYELLQTRAQFLEQANLEGAVVDPVVLRTWTTIKSALDNALRKVSDRLAVGATAADLNAASVMLAGAVEFQIRPMSYEVWPEPTTHTTSLRIGALFREVFASWKLPLPEILVTMGVIVGVGSLVRSGLIAGGLYTLRYLAVLALVLWISTAISKKWSKSAPATAVVTLIALPFILLGADELLGQQILHLPADPLGQVLVDIATPIATVLIAMTVNATRHRKEILQGLQRRIDADAALLLSKSAQRDAQLLSVFVHHSVQSELSAVALQLSEAALTADIDTIESVRLNAIARLNQLTELDGATPPWLHTDSSVDRIHAIVLAWKGLLEIEVTLPPADSCREDQWHVAEQIIAEGIANAVRHGKASKVEIRGVAEEGSLVIEIHDDGSGETAGTSPSGIGQQWLDRIAPHDWSLEHREDGSNLRVVIR